MAKEKTLEEIREQLKGTDYDSDAWALDYFQFGQTEGLTIKEWISKRDEIEKEYLDLQKKPEFRDMGPAVQLNINESGDVFLNNE